MLTYLVTGGAGFIGSHVVDLLRANGHEAIVVDDLSKGLRANLPLEVPLHTVDIADRDTLLGLTNCLPPLAGVLHLAAQASVVVSTTDPARDLAVNVAGTINVLDLCSRLGCPLVFASTGGATYGANAPRPTPETVTAEPAAPYGASKASAEVYVRMWARQTGLPHAILRLGNVYGPRQRGDGEAGVVAIFATRLAGGEPVTLYGEGTPTRDYVHVRDVATALLAALGNAVTVNVATGVETPVARVLELVQVGLGVADTDVSLAPLRPGELMHSCLDIRRAAAEIGWSPTIPVETGIPQTASAIAG